MFLEPFISNAVANQLQVSPRTLNEIPISALERNRLPMIAGFDTFIGTATGGTTGLGCLGRSVNQLEFAQIVACANAAPHPPDTRPEPRYLS